MEENVGKWRRFVTFVTDELRHFLVLIVFALGIIIGLFTTALEWLGC